MENLDIDKIISAMADPETGNTIESIMHGMDEAQKIMGKFEKLVATMDRMGLKAGIMRMAGAKLGVDVDTPLGGDKTLNVGIEPATKYHEALYNQLNGVSQEDLQRMMEAGEKNVDNTEGEAEADD